MLYFREGQQVDKNCIVCGRVPCKGEVYGGNRTGWESTDICPKCWGEPAPVKTEQKQIDTQLKEKT